tara:strand:+ start:158 stop:508 length:351 start_codon:yes stop_codon:yes gene_type:complete
MSLYSKVLIDERKPRWNLFYLLKLKKKINDLNIEKIFDLQNSSRTSFYRKFIFKNSKWSSSETTLPKGKTKKDFDHSPVLERFNFQLENSNIKTKHTLKPNFGWACENIDNLKKKI